MACPPLASPTGLVQVQGHFPSPIHVQQTRCMVFVPCRFSQAWHIFGQHARGYSTMSSATYDQATTELHLVYILSVYVYRTGLHRRCLPPTGLSPHFSQPAYDFYASFSPAGELKSHHHKRSIASSALPVPNGFRPAPTYPRFVIDGPWPKGNSYCRQLTQKLQIAVHSFSLQTPTTMHARKASQSSSCCGNLMAKEKSPVCFPSSTSPQAIKSRKRKCGRGQ